MATRTLTRQCTQSIQSFLNEIKSHEFQKLTVIQPLCMQSLGLINHDQT